MSSVAPMNSTVGRASELGEISGLISSVASGEGLILLVTGEPGMGKTHLLREAKVRAADSGVRVVSLRSVEGDVTQPFGAMLRLAVLSQVEAPRSTVHEIERFEFGRKVLKALGSMPTVLVIDDIQWWDYLSLHTVLHLIDELLAIGVGVLGSSRPLSEMGDTATASTIRSLLRMSRHIELAGVDRNDVIDLVRQGLGKEITEETVDKLSSLTMGNPFFILEFIRAAQPLASPESVRLPTEIEALIDGRLNHLAEHEEALALAAVFGSVTLLTDLTAAANNIDLDISGLEIALARAEKLNIAMVEGKEILFVHALYARQLVHRLSFATRERFHAAVALVLFESGNVLAALHHISYSGRALSIVDARGIAWKAFGSAQETGSYDATILAGLWLISEGAISEGERLRLLIAVANAEISVGERTRGRRHAQEAFSVARDLNLHDAAAQALIVWCTRIDYTPNRQPIIDAFSRLTFEDLSPNVRVAALAMKARATAMVPDSGSGAINQSSEAVRQTSDAARDWTMNTDESRSLAQRALDEMAAVPEVDISLESRLAAMQSWRETHLSPEFVDERVALSERSIMLAEAEPRLTLSARVGDIIDLWERNDLALADRRLSDLGFLSLQQGDFHWEWAHGYLSAARLHNRADFDGAAQASQHAFQRGELADEPGRLTIFFEQQLFTMIEKNTIEATKDFLNASVDALVNPYVRSVAALVNAASGDVVNCNVHLAECAHVIETDNREMGWLSTMANLVEAAYLVGRQDICRRALHALQPYGEHNAVFVGSSLRGPMGRYLGLAHASVGNFDDALRELENARALCVASQQRLYSFACSVEIAEVLSRSDAPQVLSRVSSADLETATLSPMAWRSSRLHEAYVVAQGALAKNHGLDERQFRVLRGLAKGKTIQEIGEALGYSHSTVRKASMVIYQVLNCAGREEAVAKAHALNLC